MRPGTLAVILGHRRQQVSQTFTANATWTAPVTTSSIDNASGKGAAGTPGTPDTGGRTGWYRLTITNYHRRDGSGTDQTSSSSAPVYGSPMPASYCDPQVFYTTSQSTVYDSSDTCYEYLSYTEPTTPGTPATTGASSTAFGKTFPGGTGGAATTTTFTNIAITPGASYSIVVPSGGSITITYTQ